MSNKTNHELASKFLNVKISKGILTEEQVKEINKIVKLHKGDCKTSISRIREEIIEDLTDMLEEEIENGNHDKCEQIRNTISGVATVLDEMQQNEKKGLK